MLRLFKTTKELIEKEQAKKHLNHEYYLKHRKRLLRSQHDKHLEKKNSSIRKIQFPKFPSARELKEQQRIETFQRTIREIDKREVEENSKIAKKEIQGFEPWYPKKRSETQSQSEEERLFKKRERSRKWMLEHPEQAKEYNRKWKQEHPEKVKEASRRWRQKHPEQARENTRKWAREHPEQVRENGRKWRQKHPENDREKSRKWRQEHPGYDRLRDQKNPEAHKRKSLIHYHKHREQILAAKQLGYKLEKARREFPETIAKLTEFLVQETQSKK
jgi:hypothetical protein